MLFEIFTSVYNNLNKKIMQLEKTSVALISEPLDYIKNQLVFAFSCQPEDILDLFEEISSQLGFQLIERETTHSTSIKKPEKKKGIINIMDCFGCWNLDGVTAVKIILSKHSQKGKMKDTFIAQLKGLVGISQQISSFLTIFSQKIQKNGYSLPTPKIVLEQQTTFFEDISENETPYYIQACSFHLINKILIDKKYEVHQSMLKMVEDFRNTFKNLEESVGIMPMAMKNAISIVSDLHGQLELLLKQLKYPKQVSKYLRISVENFIFNKVENQLFSIYHFKNLKTQAQFQKKREKIISTYTIRQIFAEVCLNQKFWSFNKDKKDENLSLQQLKKSIYFTVVCKQFQKIVFTNSPRQKIKYCQLAYTELKNHFYDFSQRKYELTSMEDIIPVLIVVVLLLEIGSLRSQFDIMLDFISLDPNQMQAQKRLLINLSESYNYIFRDWTIKQQQ